MMKVTILQVQKGEKHMRELVTWLTLLVISWMIHWTGPQTLLNKVLIKAVKREDFTFLKQNLVREYILKPWIQKGSKS